ncbi:MAG: hypothetical protein U1F16_16125 [Turneriella sp.]
MIKPENDILFIFTKIDSEKDLKLATAGNGLSTPAIHDLAPSLDEIPSALKCIIVLPNR